MKVFSLVHKKNKLLLRTVIIFILKSVVVAFLISVGAQIVGSNIISKSEEIKLQKVNEMRKDLQGFWLIRTRIQESDFEEFKGIETWDTGNLTVDSNFNVAGTFYRWSELNKDGKHTYPRALRRKSEVNGSLIDKSITLNLVSKNYSNLESSDVLEGNLIKEGIIKGNYFSDVAFSKGVFCAKRIQMSQIGSDINCDL